MWAAEEVATVSRQTLPQSPLYILMMCTAHEADLISATPAAHTHTHTTATDTTASRCTHRHKSQRQQMLWERNFASKYSYLVASLHLPATLYPYARACVYVCVCRASNFNINSVAASVSAAFTTSSVVVCFNLIFF